MGSIRAASRASQVTFTQVAASPRKDFPVVESSWLAQCATLAAAPFAVLCAALAYGRMPLWLFATILLALLAGVLVLAELQTKEVAGALAIASAATKVRNILARAALFIFSPDTKAQDLEMICPCRRRVAFIKEQSTFPLRDMLSDQLTRAAKAVAKRARRSCSFCSRRRRGDLRRSTDGTGDGVGPDLFFRRATTPQGRQRERRRTTKIGLDPFDKAVRWLKQRKRGGVGFRDQVRLHSLYMQAVNGDHSTFTAQHAPPGTKASPRGAKDVVTEVKELGWMALEGMAPAMARKMMPRALAEVDFSFAAQNSKLCPVLPTGQDGSWVVAALQLVERNLPLNLDAMVARTQENLCCLCSMAFSAAVWVSCSKKGAALVPQRTKRWWPLIAATSGVAAAMFGVLAHGLPASAHATFQMKIGGIVHEHSPNPLEAGGRLKRRLARFFMPRVSTSLFADAK